MPKLDIDKLCEPIEVHVGGKDYKIDDISEEQATRMQEISQKAKKRQDEGKDPEPGSEAEMLKLLSEIMGAKEGELAQLGMRKRLVLITQIMKTINEEIEGKNSPGVDAVK